MMKGRMVAVLIRTCCGYEVEMPDANGVADIASGFPGAFNRGVKVQADLLYADCLVSEL
jgi:hypothetical protein